MGSDDLEAFSVAETLMSFLGCAAGGDESQQVTLLKRWMWVSLDEPCSQYPVFGQPSFLGFELGYLIVYPSGDRDLVSIVRRRCVCAKDGPNRSLRITSSPSGCTVLRLPSFYTFLQWHSR